MSPLKFAEELIRQIFEQLHPGATVDFDTAPVGLPQIQLMRAAGGCYTDMLETVVLVRSRGRPLARYHLMFPWQLFQLSKESNDAVLPQETRARTS